MEPFHELGIRELKLCLEAWIQSSLYKSEPIQLGTFKPAL